MDDPLQQRLETEEIHLILAKFFFACNIPFRVVENPYFIAFVDALLHAGVNYKLPCRKTLGGSILFRLYQYIISEKKLLLDDTDSVLLCDGWKNTPCNRKYLVFTLRTIHTWQTFLTYSDISLESESANNLRMHIQNAIDVARDKYNSRVFAACTDNDIKITSAVEISRTSDNKKLIQSTCSSHSGNLLIKEFTVEDFINKIREIVKTFSQSKYDALLRDIFKGTKVKNFPETRFCYLRNTCNSILENLNKLLIIAEDIEDVQLKDSVISILHDEDFLLLLELTVNNLDPICRLINKCQEPQCNVADSTEMWLSLELPTHQYDSQIAQRIKKAIYPVGYAANLLHPTYQGLLLTNEQKEIAENFLKEYCDPETLNEWDYYKNNQYMFNNLADNCQNDGITYWSNVSLVLPHIGKFAVKIMLIPASTALIEGLFSSWTYVHNIYRNKLKNDKSAALLDTYHTLKNYVGRMINK